MESIYPVSHSLMLALQCIQNFLRVEGAVLS